VAQERRTRQRRRTDRRAKPGDAKDVTRIEHDNLAAEMAKLARQVRRLEQDVSSLRDVVDRFVVRSPTGAQRSG